MESSMDFQVAAPVTASFSSDDALEPPAMDTEQDRPTARPGITDPADTQPEGPPFSTLCPGSERDWPFAKTEQRDSGPIPVAPDPAGGGDAQVELCQDLRRETEEADGWKLRAGSTSQHMEPPCASSSSDLADMELDEENTEDEPSEMLGLLAQLQTLDTTSSEQEAPLSSDAAPTGARSPRGYRQCHGKCQPCPLHVATGRGLETWPCCTQHMVCSRPCHGLLFAEADREDLLSLLRYDGGLPEAPSETPLAHSDVLTGTNLEKLQAPEKPAALGAPEVPGRLQSSEEGCSGDWCYREGLCKVSSTCEDDQDSSPEPTRVALFAAPAQEAERPPQGSPANKEFLPSCPAFRDVPGPCDPEDLLDGVIFGAKYLGSTQLVSERNPPTSVRMAQAQEAVDRIKAPEGESQPMTEVDLFISTQRIKVLTADTQEAMMDHSLQTISYIADIGPLVVLMARRKLPRQVEATEQKRLYKMICHVFHSADSQIIAQAIGQAFGVAYQRFLEANSINPSELSPRQYSRALEDQEHYNAELTHFSKQENCKDVCIRKQKGEILGIAIVESGWGSIVPTVVIANLMHGSPAEKSGELSIGDRLMSVNRTSLVGLPLTTCQSIIRELKHQTEVTLNIVHCPPVTTAVIRRPDSKYQLGFCVENGVICSLMRGGIAEKGGIRVGHRIIEINGQSVVATPHEKIIQILTQAVSEVHIKTMPASTYRLLTGQEQPIFL